MAHEAEAITPAVEAGIWYDVASRAVATSDALHAENAKLRLMNASLRGQVSQLRAQLQEARRKHAAAVVRTLREPSATA